MLNIKFKRKGCTWRRVEKSAIEIKIRINVNFNKIIISKQM